MTTSASDPELPPRPSGRLRTLGLMAGRGLATFVIVAGVGILGVQHYHRVARAKKAGGGLVPTVIEPARTDAGLGSQRLTVDGLDLMVNRSWEAGSPERVRSRLAQRNQALGWEALAPAPDALPATVRTRPEFRFLCFMAPNQKIVGYALNPDGTGTRITATELDLRQVVRKSGRRNSAVPVSAEYAGLMPHPPRLALSGGESGSQMFMVVAPAADSSTVAEDIRQRFLRDGWTLEPWDAVVGADGMVSTGGEWIVAQRGGSLCHVMITREDGETLASYRFSPSRPARTEP